MPEKTDSLPAEYATIRAALTLAAQIITREYIESRYVQDALADLDRLAAREVPAATDAGASALDTERINKLERILADEEYYKDVLLQSDAEDGVWIALRDKGMHGGIVEDGQEAKALTLRAAIDAVPDREDHRRTTPPAPPVAECAARNKEES